MTVSREHERGALIALLQPCKWFPPCTTSRQAKWVKGRWRTPQQQGRESEKEGRLKKRVAASAKIDSREHGTLENEDLFRGEGYKKAVKQVFYQEFRNLSHSTIKGVLAEQNFSYTLARPVLQQVSSRTWRISLSSLWSKRVPSTSADGHPFIIWRNESGGEGDQVPAVKRTGNAELDHELHELFVAPLVTRKRQDAIVADYLKASELNEREAEEASALFDCDCCFGEVPFENIATCDDGCHTLCLDCIRRTVNEALYGQGWSRTADLRRGTVRCFSPSASDCEGCISRDLVRRALTQGSDKDDAWHDFQDRVTSETLLQSGLPLQRCPFCNYAEVDELPKTRLKHPLAVWHHVTTRSSPAVQIMFTSLLMALAIFTIPITFILAIAWLATQFIPPAKKTLNKSITRVHKRRQTPKFKCLNPTCSRISCARCLSPWRDPHACFESEKTSLRTAIEASATAAVKRTCPKCYLSFVKSSGCNKLVCNCGYTMCYICRSEITTREGYAHFCQHFRPNGGRCGECERCDLYGDEDEDVVVRRAAEEAERVWREKEEGGKTREGINEEEGKLKTKAMIEALVGEGRVKWYDEYLDAVVDAVIV